MGPNSQTTRTARPHFIVEQTMAIRCIALFCLATSVVAYQHIVFRRQDPVGDVSNGDVPTAGEAVGTQTGVDVPNPHDYTGAIVGGGVAGTFVTLAIFCIATYMCYQWNTQMKEKGDEPHCGLLSCLCCC